MENQFLKITNANVITPSGIRKNASLVVENGQIKEITDRNVEINDALVIDAKGMYVAPGCIDTHVHGGGGHDFTEVTEEAFIEASLAHARGGMTAIYPTIGASHISLMWDAIRVCESVMSQPVKSARIMGLHLEGNYLNKVMCGGQKTEHLYDPDKEEYSEILRSTNCVKRWSAAPELPGALEFGRYASERGVVVSLAHTVADYPLVTEAFKSGYTHATHFYNAMTCVHKKGMYKTEGTIESIYLTEDMTVELVADGIHVPPSILKLVHKYKGAEKISLITDAMAAAGDNGTGKDIYGGRSIIENGAYILADHSALAGSIATANMLMRTMITKAGISLEDTVRMASEAPARVMNVFDRKGSLEKGKDADIIIFDDQINILATIVEGHIIYNTL